MSSHSDSELKVNTKSKKNICVCFKVNKKGEKKIRNVLKLRNHPELLEARLLNAVSTNNTEVVQKLLESGVSANSSDRQLRSALHIAASRNYADIIKLLLQHGADPNKKDIMQNTPLHLAACTNSISTITLLLNAGADVSSLDMHGRNPLQLAKSKLELLQRSWRQGEIQMINLKIQLQQIVELMISLWQRQQSGIWSQHRSNVDDLHMMKLSLNDEPDQKVDDQMSKLLLELQEFSIK